MRKSKRPPRYGGQPLEHWNGQWEPLDGGFGIKHKKVYGRSGLYRAVLAKKVVFIGCSKDLDARLQQLRSERNLKTNNYYSARKKREHVSELELEVLLPVRCLGACLSITALKWAMVRHSRPLWNYSRPIRRKNRK